jgi:hypothetical protein
VDLSCMFNCSTSLLSSVEGKRKLNFGAGDDICEAIFNTAFAAVTVVLYGSCKK